MIYFKYFKGQCNPDRPCYYRVYSDELYEWFNTETGRWHLGTTNRWSQRYSGWYIKPTRVSKLEVLLVLGYKAVEE